MKTFFPGQKRFGEWERGIVLLTYRDLAIGRISEWDIVNEGPGTKEEIVRMYHRLRQFAANLYTKRPRGLDHLGILRENIPSMEEIMKIHDFALIRGFLRYFGRQLRSEKLKEAYLECREDETVFALSSSRDQEQRRFYMCKLHAIQRLQATLKRRSGVT